MELLEKIKLNDGTELTLVPMGIDRKDNKTILTVITSLNSLELEELVCNKENISRLQHLSHFDEELAIYTDCIKYISLEKKKDYYEEVEGLKDVYIITFSTDPILAALKATQKENAELKEQVTTLRETVDYLVLSQLDVPLEEPEESEVEADV